MPFVLYELCNGTRLTWQEWEVTLTAAQKGAIVDLLAEKWFHVTQPVPFKAIGRILTDASGHPPSTNPSCPPPQHRPHFRIVSIMEEQLPQHTLTSDPPHCGHGNIVEFWHQEIEDTRHTVLALNVPDDISKETLDEIMRCVDIMHEMADVAASFDPQAPSSTPALALIHPDYSATQNILFSPDRTRIEGIIDWDHAVVMPRDIAALYPYELRTEAYWPTDPDDMFAIPPNTEPEDMGLRETAVQETHLRQRFRETVRKFDPQFAAFYTDPRARFRPPRALARRPLVAHVV